ncbi:MAG: type II toxin-antitoxin system toxin DNA ADP-ribosyl transferase DarT, partial [Chloroflexota bacterium]
MTPDPTPIYHITPVDNLAGIIAAGGLWATNQLRHQEVTHVSIAYEDIQDRRARKRVPCGPGGNLHDYVPFYFAPRSPMLCAIYYGRVPNCPSDQTAIVHLVSTAQAVRDAGLSYAFTDGHGAMAFTAFFDDLAQLDGIDWDVMRSRYWNDTDEFPDRKRRRQAEFLIHEFMPWGLIGEIGVCTAAAKAKVEEVLG